MVRRLVILLLLCLVVFLRISHLCNWSINTCPRLLPRKTEENSYSRVLNEIRYNVARKVRGIIPSPHSELLLGLVLGLDDLHHTPRFNDVLVSTGTIHVVVVSGFNLSLVFMGIINLIGSKYKIKGIFTALTIAFIYALITGFEPPVVRALIMLVMVSISKYYGRESAGIDILIFSAFIMLMLSPHYFWSISFHLSFFATLGILLYSNSIANYLSKVLNSRGVLVTDFGTTIAAQILVWPIIAYRFGRLSLFGPIVNALVLWLVPITTVLGFTFIISLYILPFLTKIFSHALNSFLHLFISSLYTIEHFLPSVVDVSISVNYAVGYYIILLIVHLVSGTYTNKGYK